MKKIMFNDRYGLTDAVLQGRKTMTRRIVPASTIYFYEALKRDGLTSQTFEDFVLDHSIYLTCEPVAVAQSYKTVFEQTQAPWDYCPTDAGWNNKMFVRADLMPHQIRITSIRIERLQDISDEDCLREGIMEYVVNGYCVYGFENCRKQYHLNPCEAFVALIDKVLGKGTWESNPWVFVYEFEITE